MIAFVFGLAAALPVALGRELYETRCVSCHGAALAGSANGPSLADAGGAAVDFYLRTGRMPLSDPHVQAFHATPVFDRAQIAALEAYVDSRAHSGVPIARVRVSDGAESLARGRELYEENCQQCHGAAAQGATAGGGWIAPALGVADATEIGEAVRIGPGMMPRFSFAQLSDRDLDAVASWVVHLSTHAENPGGTPVDNLGPVAEGVIGWSIGIGGLFAFIYFAGATASARRS